jgi:XRE family aerobic/anaerobic benzoate catabolism transcriptional regulator
MNKPLEPDACGVPGGATEQFLRQVGERVRLARVRRGLSRRGLSERSGVSQRYLAQLEAGEGNISIALLRRLAEALDHRIEWLVADEDPWTSGVAEITSLYRTATKEQRRKALEVLNPESVARRANRVALIGLRGAGKSTLGRLAAASLRVHFMELNDEIEYVSGIPVDEVIALYGQEGYRHLERQAVERVVAAHDTLLLAAAGGIVADPDTFKFLLHHFHTIWLRATPEEHMARVRAQGDMRPMAGNPEAMDELKTILTAREVLYGSADACVDTSGKSPDQSVADLLAVIDANRFIQPERKNGQGAIAR